MPSFLCSPFKLDYFLTYRVDTPYSSIKYYECIILVDQRRRRGADIDSPIAGNVAFWTVEYDWGKSGAAADG